MGNKVKQLLKGTPQGWKTSSVERKSYYAYLSGQNIIYNLVASCLTTYFAFIGLDLVKIAGVMAAVKVWDAVNDTLFGVIFDSVKFKSGKKYLPWLRISLVGIPIASVFMFAIPTGWSENAQLIWFAIAYVLWDSIYTLCDVPIYGILTSMTDNIDERNSMMSYRSIWGGAGGAAVPLLAALLVSEEVHSNYTVVAIISAVAAFLLMAPSCFKLQERYKPAEEEESFSVKKMFQYLFKNKYLLLYYGGFFFYSSVNYVGALNLLASYYLFHDEMFTTIVGVASAPFSFIGAMLIPKLVRKFDKMTVFRVSVMAAVVLGVLMWAIGYSNPVYFLIISIIRSIPTSTLGVMLFMFTPDCAEYGKYKSGIEAKGITFAIQTFMVKLTGAVSSALSTLLLGLPIVGWNLYEQYEIKNFADLTAINATQTTHALDAFWLIYALIPSIGYLASWAVWKCYKLNDKDVQVMAKCNAGELSREDAEKQLSRKY